ncbi:hypothetical protein ACJX0J_027954, partial [Zea mays]
IKYTTRIGYWNSFTKLLVSHYFIIKIFVLDPTEMNLSNSFYDNTTDYILHYFAYSLMFILGYFHYSLVSLQNHMTT